MQKDNENIPVEQNSLPENEKISESEEKAAPKKSAPRKKSSSEGDATKKKSASAKKSPAKKSTANSSKSVSKSKSAGSTSSSKSATAKKKTSQTKKAATKKTEETEKPTAEEKTETINTADDTAAIETTPEEILTEEETNKAPLPLPNEDIEEVKPTVEKDDNADGELIIPETAIFTTLDDNGEEISIIGDAETENANGLLNVEHFSDYTPKAEKVAEPVPYYESEDSFEENITILSEEEPEISEPTVKKEKYDDPDKEKYDPKKPRKIDARFDFVELFVFTLLAVILLTTFIFRHAVVEGPSMQNTLQDGEHLIISNLFYTPKKGDIIVCQDRATGHYEPIVKRVIATAGDTIEIIDSVVYLNGEILDEDYVFIDGEDHYSDFPEVTVPEDMIFVMGDHRNNSGDSRAFLTTFVREDAVLGKVILRFYPFDKFGSVD